MSLTTQPSDNLLWDGVSGGSWDDSLNWTDVTTGQSPASFAPGSQTGVTIAGPTGTTYEVITGGGTSASLAITGLIDLSGAYATGAALVGSVTGAPNNANFTSGNLTIGAASSLNASSFDAVEGAVTVSGAGASLSVTGATIIGAPGGFNGVPIAGQTYSYSPGGSTTLTVSGGASLSAGGGLIVDYGAVNETDSGTTIAVTGDMTLGVVPSPTNVGGAYYYGEPVNLSISGGASLSVSGALTATFDNYNPNSVSGQGSRLSVAGVLTLGEAPPAYVSVTVLDGGAVEVGGLVTARVPEYGYSNPSFSNEYLYVDNASSFEVGSAGSAATGAFTIDAGASLTANNGLTLAGGSVIDNGTIADNSDLIVGGGLSGSGLVDIGANATLTLDGPAGADDAIAFTGASATLEIYPGQPDAIAATISGFAAGDGILIDNTQITGIAYVYNGHNQGTLTLSAGGNVVEALDLAGDYAGQSFFVAPTTNGASAITLLQGQLPKPIVSIFTPSATVTNAAVTISGTIDEADAGETISVYDGAALLGTTQSNALTGAWSLDASLTRPGANVISATATDALAQTGVSASITLTLNANYTVAQYLANQASIDALGDRISISDTAANVASALDALSGDALVKSIALTDAGAPTLTVSLAQALGDSAGLQKITTPFTLAVADTPADVLALTGAQLQALQQAGIRTLTITAGTGLVSPGLAAQIAAFGLSFGSQFEVGGSISETLAPGAQGYVLTIGVDPQSSLEIGAFGGAASGAMTIDAGVTVVDALTTTLNGNLVDNGVLIDDGGFKLEGVTSGSGLVEVATGAAIAFWQGAQSGLTVDLAGTGDTLKLRSAAPNVPPAAFDATLEGFRQGDAILIDNANLTQASYQYLGNNEGTLTLSSGGNVVEALSLLGDYRGATFTVSASAALPGASEVQVSSGAPAVTIFNSNATVAAPAVTISGTVDVADEGAAVFVYDGQKLLGSATADANTGAWSLSATLTGAGANVITAKTTSSPASNAVTLTFADTVAQYLANRAALDGSGAGIDISDTAAHVLAQLGALTTDSQIKSIALTDAFAPAISLSLAKALADSGGLEKISTPFAGIVSDTPAALEGLTPAQIAQLASEGIHTLIASGNVKFTVAQTAALLAAGITAAAAGSASVQLLFANGGYETFVDGALVQQKSVAADGSYDLHSYGVAGQPYTDYDIVYTAAGKASSETWYNNGAVYRTETWNADGSPNVITTYAAGSTWGQSYDKLIRTYVGGKLAEQDAYRGAQLVVSDAIAADGSSVVHVFGGASQKYTDYVINYSAAGKATSETWYNNGAVYQSETWNADGSPYVITTYAAGSSWGQSYDKLIRTYAGGKLAEQDAYRGAQLVVSDAIAADGSSVVHVFGGASQKYTDYVINYSAAGKATSETWYNNGAVYQTETWNADGTPDVITTYAAGSSWGQSYDTVVRTYAGGALVEQNDYLAGELVVAKTFNPSGAYDVHVYGVTGQKYTDYDVAYSAAGTVTSEIWYENGAIYRTEAWNSDGSHEIRNYGLTSATADTSESFYSPTAVASEVWTKNGALTEIENWNPNGSVNSIEKFLGTATAAAPFGGQSSFDIFAFNLGTTTLGFTEDASHTFGVLTLIQGQESLALDVTGNHALTDFALTSDGHGGSKVSLATSGV